LTEWKGALSLETFALTLAALGDFETAVKWQKKAMEDAEYMNRTGEDARKRLAWYESNLPGQPKGAPKKD
jgi:hypothetical protein